MTLKTSSIIVHGIELFYANPLAKNPAWPPSDHYLRIKVSVKAPGYWLSLCWLTSLQEE
ncbi:hypothetical protein HKBW3S06_01520, partial [Candidatus Hakubella thermalkaliphila]